MDRTSTTGKGRSYDRLVTRIPKGQKQAVEAYARGLGVSVNHLLNRLVRSEMGLTEEQWQNSPNADTLAAMQEADRIAADPEVKGFTDLDALFAELRS